MTLESAQKLVYRELGIWTDEQECPGCPEPEHLDFEYVEGQAVGLIHKPHPEPMPPLDDGLLAVILRRLGKDAETSAQADKALWHIFRVVRYKQTDLVRAAVMAFAEYLEARNG